MINNFDCYPTTISSQGRFVDQEEFLNTSIIIFEAFVIFLFIIVIFWWLEGSQSLYYFIQTITIKIVI